MTDINSYTNELLVEFLDAAAEEIKRILTAAFGDDWYTKGIQPHLHASSLERTRNMLDSPMATIEMNKTDEELYGVEHLPNIVDGNWRLFKEVFGSRDRALVFLGEISELRHNIAHRRGHHVLRRTDVIRFVHNAHLLLRSLESPLATRFTTIVSHLEFGRSPWGNELGGTLPSATDIVPDFVGRDDELNRLGQWLSDDTDRPILIWGDGGAGKSALAYHFARTVRDGAPEGLQAVLWLSAKSQEYVEGESRDRLPDFDSVPSFGEALLTSMYGVQPSGEEDTSPDGIMQELNEIPSLLVIDDLDSILDDEDLAHLLIFILPNSKSRIIYTSRRRVPGIRTIDVIGFEGQDLDDFIRSRATEYDGLKLEECLQYRDGIRSVTQGVPLFVDDLLRHAFVDGLKPAMEAWSKRMGDAAREYALRRQMESLGEPARRALVGAAAANAVARRPVSRIELKDIAGFVSDDIADAIRQLISCKLLNQDQTNEAGLPTFSCNRNTQRLVQITYGRDALYEAFQANVPRALSSQKIPRKLRAKIGIEIGQCAAKVRRGDFRGAEDGLRELIDDEDTDDFAENSDIWGALGWVLSRNKEERRVTETREAFQRSHHLGSRKEDTYFHWVELEREIAESLRKQASIRTSDLKKRMRQLLEQWKTASSVARLGIERCGETRSLCHLASELKRMEAHTLRELNQYTPAENCSWEAVVLAKKALSAPNPSSREVTRTQLYRSWIVALSECAEPDETIAALEDWGKAVGHDDPDWNRERNRLVGLQKSDSF